ncbi:hypothetical protein EDD17DRAFT_1776924 [Pisolithus thermaeus]|nr:hypothetical protein EDD17DRAFT_1776924 [Pisolithus thermaeus]
MRTFHPFASSPHLQMPDTTQLDAHVQPPQSLRHKSESPHPSSPTQLSPSLLVNPPSTQATADPEQQQHNPQPSTSNGTPQLPHPSLAAASPFRALESGPKRVHSVHPRCKFQRQGLAPATRPPPFLGHLFRIRTTADPTHRSPSHSSCLPATAHPLPNGKRKLDESEQDDPHPKIRRTVREHVSQDPTRVMPMTTVMCLHAAVAQKSYGSEKRFLCPPPVVHIQGPVWQMRSQQLAMAVVSEQGDRSHDQKTTLDNNMTGSFKFLHVTGTAKAKSFLLSLDIMDPPPSVSGDGNEAAPSRVWATFDSAPVTIISKPSKKTAKTRNISSCILAGGPVSLFNRINSQTVRTKYMTIESNQLCASNSAWSAFNVNVVRRPDDAPPPHAGGPQPVTYGCEIVLSDSLSNIATSPLIIRKVDKGRVSPEDGGPVRPIPGAPGMVSPSTPGVASQGGTHPLIFQSPRVREEVKDGVRILSDEVDDYLCWTIVGISKFQYTFFDAFGQNSSIPEMPITPFPTLFTTPVYRAANNTLEMAVSHFFYDDPKVHSQQPLALTNVAPFGGGVPGHSLDMPSTSEAGVAVPGPVAPARYVPQPLHTIVTVDMPSLAEVIKALQKIGPHMSPSGADVGGGQVDGAAAGGSQKSPLLFIRAYDGVGYHSGRTVTCENVFQSMDLGAMAQGHLLPRPAATAATAEGGLHGWTLRVM